MVDTMVDLNDPVQLRGCMKMVRDPSKTAFDLLPTGETIGSFANKYAVSRYSRNVESKRARARVAKNKHRRSGISKVSAAIQNKKPPVNPPLLPLNNKHNGSSHKKYDLFCKDANGTRIL